MSGKGQKTRESQKHRVGDVFDVETNPDGKIVDFLANDSGEPLLLEPRPEEFVRQRYIRVLHYEYKYPKDVIAREVPIYYGSKEATDQHGNLARADIVVYADAKACMGRDQGKIELIIECKAPTVTDGRNQLFSYIFNTSANGAVWYNQTDAPAYFRRLSHPQNKLSESIGIPRYGQAWDSLGIHKKKDLTRPSDIKGLLRRCHNKVHGRGNDGDEADLTMDMVRIILAKAKDEELPDPEPIFYCTPREYSTDSGRKAVADRVQGLFKKVADANPTVFQRDERITIGATLICDVATELQGYKLLSDLYQASDWDLMGSAYEQYTATYLKRQKGQFFTNRLVTDFMVAVLDPDYSDTILDPAGGSGGFLTSAMRYVRKKILDRAQESDNARVAAHRQLDLHRTKIFMVEASKRLVKIANTAMILNGDGHAGMTCGDSLGPYENLDKTLQVQAGKGLPTIILTNPPFAGVGEGRITDEKILNNFVCGIKRTEREGKFENIGTVEDGVPPEMLFLERCMDWIAPGGKIGIVMPKAFLDTQTYQTARAILMRDFRLLAVVNCDKNTFQPHTGVRTCMVFAQRPNEDEPPPLDYEIFMAISRCVGQDSEGMPIFKLDAQYLQTEDLNEDLTEILADWRAFQTGRFQSSEYRFGIKRSDIGSNLIINPQFHLPTFNNTIKELESIDGKYGWSVVSLDMLAKGTYIFKAPRMRTENLIAEGSGPTFETYHTPSSVLQEKGEAAKNIDISRASKSQLTAIKSLRVNRGDILITRSGTIGRVAYATGRIEGMIVSDDMIRVRILDEKARLYAYAFLQSRAALNQMLKNEYGTIQQHLEARHVQAILVPMPPSWECVQPIIDLTRRAIEARETLEDANVRTQMGTRALMEFLVSASQAAADSKDSDSAFSDGLNELLRRTTSGMDSPRE